ncbi:DNA polymerase III subunit gamma/tau, partial [Brevundimonas sp. Root1423]|uniref:DNA polymerase III subunit gamma/tau n=2 Tax=unclassified Brevundimonas TaxID=2622653 RepID=UPI0012E3F43B
MSDADPSLDGPPWEEDAPDGDVVERDPDTDDMFGAPEPAGMREAEAAAIPDEPKPEAKAAKRAAPADSGPAAHVDDGEAYTVLARKYRPHTFEDLIGQEAMVRTLTNAFATGRIAHAFMLTGVRGVGKTTTARLLARALNNETDSIDRPSLALTDQGRHDASIMAGQHMDVVEMDAASHTGIDGIRDIIESVRYAPVEARYKVYVLDEVHMLSNQAFNALLKTLEEPPPHAKFIFATTEIRKVPVTILSRCQRFDLRRVEP